MVAAARVLQIISVWMTMRCYAHSKAKYQKIVQVKKATHHCLSQRNEQIEWTRKTKRKGKERKARKKYLKGNISVCVLML